MSNGGLAGNVSSSLSAAAQTSAPKATLNKRKLPKSIGNNNSNNTNTLAGFPDPAGMAADLQKTAEKAAKDASKAPPTLGMRKKKKLPSVDGPFKPTLPDTKPTSPNGPPSPKVPDVAGKLEDASTDFKTGSLLPKLPGGGGGGNTPPQDPGPPNTPSDPNAPGTPNMPGNTPGTPKKNDHPSFPWWKVVGGIGNAGFGNRVVYYPAASQVTVVERPVVVESSEALPRFEPQAEPAAAVSDSIDLELLSVHLVDSGDASRKFGPRYRVAFRNNGTVEAGNFQVLLMASHDGSPHEGDPSATAEVLTLSAGQVGSVDIRLPIAADPRTYVAMIAAIDSGDQIGETDEDNNSAPLDRSRIAAIP